MSLQVGFQAKGYGQQPLADSYSNSGADVGTLSFTLKGCLVYPGPSKEDSNGTERGKKKKKKQLLWLLVSRAQMTANKEEIQ